MVVVGTPSAGANQVLSFSRSGRDRRIRLAAGFRRQRRVSAPGATRLALAVQAVCIAPPIRAVPRWRNRPGRSRLRRTVTTRGDGFVQNTATGAASPADEADGIGAVHSGGA